MNKLCVIFLFILFFSGNTKIILAQKSNFIIAGKYTANDSLYVNNLQIILNSYTHQNDSLSLDINRDNTFDVRIVSHAVDRLGEHSYNSILKSININALYSYDSVYSPPLCNVKRYEYGDTIDHKSKWIRSFGYFAGYYQTPPNQPRIWGEWCNEPGYLGLMIISGSDTIFSWVHMQVYGWGQGTRIDSFVFQRRPVGIPISIEKETFSIYPNPVNDIITVNSSKLSKGIYTILDISGRELIKQQITQSNTQINVSNLANGVYFLKLENNNSFEVRKIIKQ